jgi:hypothetical protein
MVIKKVYIAGSVTGRHYDEAYRHFENAEVALRKYGFDVVNPMRIVHRQTNWIEAMKKCIPALMESDAIYMLKSYEFSQGAKLELFLALNLGYAIDFEVIQCLPFQNYKNN